MFKESLLIAKKELVEILRDRATLLILLIPMLIFPVLNLGLNYFNKESVSEVTIAVVSEDIECYRLFSDFAKNNGNYIIKEVRTKEPGFLLERGKVDFVLYIQKGKIKFVYNSASYNSLSTATKIGEVFEKYYYSQLQTEMPQIHNFVLENENGIVEDISDSITNIFIPVILVMLVFQGISSFANDLFAGEKERKTLELIFLSGVHRASIYFGKVIALLCLSILNLLISIGTFLLFSFFINSDAGQIQFLNKGNAVINIVIMVISLLILSIISVFLSITISMISSNMKNAQIVNGIIMSIPIVLEIGFSIGIIKMTNLFYNLIPIGGIIAILNDAYLGKINITNIILAILSSIIFLILIIIFGIRYIKSEKILNSNI